MKRLCVLMIILFSVLTTWARPGYSKPVEVAQPDGTTVTLLMHGDEFLSFMTTTDGYTVVKGDDGYYRYAEKVDGRLSATAFVARNYGERSEQEKEFLAGQTKYVKPVMSQAAQQMRQNAAQMIANIYKSPTDGKRRVVNLWSPIDYSKFKGLVVLVEFNDRQFTMDDPQSFYQRMTNERNLIDQSHHFYPVDVTGSVRDYFYDNSMGIFDPTFEVVGPVLVDFSCEYPCPKTADGTTDANYSDRMIKLLKAALAEAAKTVDFSNYDINDDNVIDMVYFIFAGYGSYVQGNSYKYIWPHASDMTSYAKNNNWSYDGKTFGRYACSVEIQDNESLADRHVWLDGIGTMCHEFSHVLGLADHYDVNYDENGLSEHPDSWDVMAGSTDLNYGLTPAGYNGFERHVLGFTEPEVINVAGDYHLESFNTANKCFIINTGTANDDYYIENRQLERWDAYLPGHGLLAWRVETTSEYMWANNRVNCNSSHMYMQLLKAVPSRDINTGYTPFPGKGNVVDLTAFTKPALVSWEGKGAVLDLYDITESNGLISFFAGKNVYEQVVEDFEKIDPTYIDATVDGTFCQWTLKNATISEPANSKGNGNRVVAIGRSGSLKSSAMDKPVRKLSMELWNGPQDVKVNFKYSADGTTWQTLRQQLSLKKNAQTTVSIDTPIPAGSQVQVEMLATSTSAVLYVDDFSITFDKDASEDIASVRTNSTSGGAAYNMAGQRVSGAYRGLVVRDGRKYIVK